MPKRLACPYGQNNLLATLVPEDRALLDPDLSPIRMEQGFVMEQPGELVGTVYFLTSGVGSVVAVARNARRIETGLFGCEGMSGLAVVLESEFSPHETFAQVEGEALSIDAGRLRHAMDRSGSMRRHLLRYVQAQQIQTAHTALSNGQATVEERLARWLLMCHDRIDGDEIHLTHVFLSIMLGVRRAGVTVALHTLEGKGLIRSRRSSIVILDRDGLETLASASYGTPEAEYARLISSCAEAP